MAEARERILVVESDPIVSDLIARQVLGAMGFKVKVVTEASSALQETLSFSPDVVFANLDLPGLSGKDLMAALSSQNLLIPVIMIAPKGQEKDVIQAFRLGASDYIATPVREAEVASAVERALKTVRARREREALREQLERTNQELQRRVNELTTLFSVGKAVTSVTDQRKLFKMILESGQKITRADIAWLLMLDERTNKYILSDHINLPKSLQEYLNQPWDDGISSLVALSGETLTINGEPLKRFQISTMGQAAMVVPVKAGKSAIALLVMLRKANKEFEPSDKAMLEAVSDYASISLVNSRLFRALDQRAASLQTEMERSHSAERSKDEMIQNVSHELRTPLVSAKGYIDMLVNGDMGNLVADQKDALGIAQQKLLRVLGLVEAMTLMMDTAAPKKLKDHNLNELASQALGRYQTEARKHNVKLSAQLPKEPLIVHVDDEQISIVFDQLLSNALKFSPNGGPVTVTVQRGRENTAQVSVTDNGIGIGKKHLTQIFERFFQVDGSTTRQFGGLGIGLALVREIVTAHGGVVGVESKPEQGSSFHFSLPLKN
ncbi:MAG: response regulator [Anaerolineae bacterium]|nr:MAG: response regulator [Anaerolineae bacterium]